MPGAKGNLAQISGQKRRRSPTKRPVQRDRSFHFPTWASQPQVPQILIQPLTEDEIRRVLAAIPPHTPEGVRNYAITLLFLDAGIRLRELLSPKTSDIDFAVGQFKVFGKSAEERIVPMRLTARRAVIRYLEHFRPQPVNPQESKLFLTVAGDPITIESVGSSFYI